MFIGINIILAASLHLIIGITGQFSIGHAGFLAVGAYASAVMTMKLEMPFYAALIVGGLAAALCRNDHRNSKLTLKGRLPGDCDPWFWGNRPDRAFEY